MRCGENETFLSFHGDGRCCGGGDGGDDGDDEDANGDNNESPSFSVVGVSFWYLKALVLLRTNPQLKCSQ